MRPTRLDSRIRFDLDAAQRHTGRSRAAGCRDCRFLEQTSTARDDMADERIRQRKADAFLTGSVLIASRRR